MRLLDKYILREFLIPLSFCVVGFSMMNVIYDLFGNVSKFIEARASAGLVLRYYSCIILKTLEYILPASLLFSTMYTQWRFAKNNELTAMRACGVGFSRIMMPYLTIAFLISIMSMVMKETVTPAATRWAETLSDSKFKSTKRQFHHDLAYYNSVNNREWMIGTIDLNDPKEIDNVRVRLERKDNSCFEEIFAKSAQWLDGQWWFFEGYRQPYNSDGIPDKGQKPIALNPAGELVPELTETPSDFTSEIISWEYLSAAQMLEYFRKHPHVSKEAIASKRTDFHARLALPWACLVVTLFGIPVGAKGIKQNALAGIFLAVAFFLGFYFLIHLGIFCGKKQIVWPWLGSWFSNIVSFILGLIMVSRMK